MLEEHWLPLHLDVFFVYLNAYTLAWYIWVQSWFGEVVCEGTEGNGGWEELYTRGS